MRLIDKQYLKTPFYGTRSMTHHLKRQGYPVNRKRIQRLMRQMGLEAIYPSPTPVASILAIRSIPISCGIFLSCVPIRSGQRYHLHPMNRGFMFLVVVMDWHSRRVLSWRLSNTLDAEFCVAALQEAITWHGTPEIFNTDQGAQFTSQAFTTVLEAHGIAVSMDAEAGTGQYLHRAAVVDAQVPVPVFAIFRFILELRRDLRNGSCSITPNVPIKPLTPHTR